MAEKTKAWSSIYEEAMHYTRQGYEARKAELECVREKLNLLDAYGPVLAAAGFTPEDFKHVGRYGRELWIGSVGGRGNNLRQVLLSHGMREVVIREFPDFYVSELSDGAIVLNVAVDGRPQEAQQ